MKKSIITVLILCLQTTFIPAPQTVSAGDEPIWYQPPTKETRKWSWLGSLGALCENVGVHGAYRVNVEAQTEKKPSGALTISAMTLWVTGAVIQKDNTVTTAKLEVKKGDTVVNTVILARPDSNTSSLEPDPQAGESWRLYLPKAKPSIEVPKDAKIFFTVTAQIKLEGGICVLGVSKEKVDPFIPTSNP